MITKQKLEIVDVCLLNLDTFNDERGSFSVTYTDEINKVLGINTNWIQENESLSHKNVFRGLHFQKKPYSQSKLIRVSNGRILDILVDLRKNSKTFKKCMSIVLDSRGDVLFVPQGIAHGFLSLENNTIVNYKCDNLYNPKSESGLNPFKSNMDINWNINEKALIMSNKDNKLPHLNESYSF